jgi:hypothetical protein
MHKKNHNHRTKGKKPNDVVQLDGTVESYLLVTLHITLPSNSFSQREKEKKREGDARNEIAIKLGEESKKMSASYAASRVAIDNMMWPHTRLHTNQCSTKDMN